MNKIFLLFLLILAKPMEAKTQETYGKTLNLGLGLGYYGYLGGSTPVILGNYEFDAAKNFTLAPFMSFYSYNSSYYWSDANYYSVVVIPLGVKASYYFDQIFELNDKWDIYGGASLGFSISIVNWNSDYAGRRTLPHRAAPLYLDVHAGAEFHINRKIGLFLDLSSGVSSIGIAIHMD